jgi:hypothetical protein
MNFSDISWGVPFLQARAATAHGQPTSAHGTMLTLPIYFAVSVPHRH